MKNLLLILSIFCLFSSYANANNYIRSYKDVDGMVVKGVAVKNQRNYKKLDINNKSLGKKYSNPQDKYKNSFSKPTKKNRNNSKRNLRAIKW